MVFLAVGLSTGIFAQGNGGGSGRYQKGCLTGQRA
jgi:hypothetical protein